MAGAPEATKAEVVDALLLAEKISDLLTGKTIAEILTPLEIVVASAIVAKAKSDEALALLLNQHNRSVTKLAHNFYGNEEVH